MRRTIFFGAAAFLAGVAFFGAVFLTAVFVAGAFVLNMMIVESRRGVPHTAPSRSRPSLRPSRTPRSIDRWNIPIGTDGIPIERPDRGIGTDRTPRSNAPIQIQIEIEAGAEIGGSVTHTTTSRDSSIDLDRGIPSGRSIWIGVIVRSFVRTDRGIPSIDRSISMAFVWITSTSRDSRKKMRPTGGTPSRAFRTTERASERRAGDARGRRESLGRSCRARRSFVSFVSIVRVVRETRRGARGWLKCK